VLLEGLLFRERIRRNEALLVLLVSLGLVLVTPAFDLASEATGGLLWALFSGLLFSLLSLTNRAGSGRLPAVQAALWQNLVVSLSLLAFAAPGLGAVAPVDWLWIGLLGIFCTGVAHSLFVASLAVIKARTAAVVFGMEPVYGIAVAWLVFAETPTVRMLLGGALIILAIVLSSRLGASAAAAGRGRVTQRSLWPRPRWGSIWSRTRCFSTLASGKPPSALRSQICTPLQVMRKIPPVPGSSATRPRSSANVLSNSWASHAARSSHWHWVQ